MINADQDAVERYIMNDAACYYPINMFLIEYSSWQLHEWNQVRDYHFIPWRSVFSAYRGYNAKGPFM